MDIALWFNAFWKSRKDWYEERVDGVDIFGISSGLMLSSLRTWSKGLTAVVMVTGDEV